MRLSPILLATLVALVPAAASRAAPARALQAPEAALESIILMQVEGVVTIEPDGTVGGLSFDTKFEDALRGALESKMRAWRFKPVLVAGQARRAQTPFRVMLAAGRLDGQYQVRIDDTGFGGVEGTKAMLGAVVPDGVAPPITAKRMVAPQYPMTQQRAGEIGRVHLVIRVAPDGRVADVLATQSLAFDIGGSESDASARRSIHSFEVAAIAAARRWTFNVPAAAAARSASDMTVSTDVEYVLRYDTTVAGQWIAVKRAPKRPVAWLPPEQADGTGAGMSATGEVAGVNSPYRLATPVAGNVVM